MKHLIKSVMWCTLLIAILNGVYWSFKGLIYEPRMFFYGFQWGMIYGIITAFIINSVCFMVKRKWLIESSYTQIGVSVYFIVFIILNVPDLVTHKIERVIIFDFFYFLVMFLSIGFVFGKIMDNYFKENMRKETLDDEIK
jgi:hypothetical protein